MIRLPPRLLYRNHPIKRVRYVTTIGIRREDPHRIWERRTPLTPQDVSSLLQDSDGEVKVEVESCLRRCYTNTKYEEAGAQVVSNLTAEADIVLGIKEPPVKEVSALNERGGRKKTWMVFSHTHKGQEGKQPLLSAFLQPGRQNTLIDYELLTAPTDAGDLKRVAAFGWYAGAVGAGEALSITGLALLKKGIASPLLHFSRPYTYSSIAEYEKALAATGESVRENQKYTGMKPLVIGLTGGGNVARGVSDMLNRLGVRWISWEELSSVASSKGNPDHAREIYACAIPSLAYFVKKDGSRYSRSDYYTNPNAYHSIFAQKIAPYLTTLINGAGWQQNFPRIMTTEELELLKKDDTASLVAVQDVTCDIKGNLEFVDQHTTIDQPFWEGPGGVLISSTDILPTELPADASQHFSSRILPYIRHLTGLSASEQSQAVLTESLDRATIIGDGKLKNGYEWLQPDTSFSPNSKLEDTRSKSSSPASTGRKKVLLLGSGLVAGPAVEVFVARKDVQLYIASNNVREGQALVRNRNHVQVRSLDVSDSLALSEAVASVDVVVSLLPAPMHVQVAKYCIKHGKHLVTASYVSPEMKSLHQQAVEKNVMLLGECGLDPGIDTMAAMRIMDRVKREGRKVTSFVSWCGGLPDPSASNLPLSYKFSWSPRAVLTAAMNDAKYKMAGKQVNIAGNELLSSAFPDVQLWKALNLEGLANRDSLPYAEKYGLGPLEGLNDCFRGTLRYKGFSKLLGGFKSLGLMSQIPLAKKPESWEHLLRLTVSSALGESQVIEASGLIDGLKALLSEPDDTTHALSWLGFLPTQLLDVPPLPDIHSRQPLDYFAYLLSHKMAYQPHERDLALLHHSFTLASDTSSNAKPSRVTASSFHYGTAEASAMSTTVGKTLAFAALRVLDGKVKGRGVMGPYEREVWEGVLDSLEEVGVRVEEHWD